MDLSRTLESPDEQTTSHHAMGQGNPLVGKATPSEGTQDGKGSAQSRSPPTPVETLKLCHEDYPVKAADKQKSLKSTCKNHLPVEVKNRAGNIITAAPGQPATIPEHFFWEVESVVGCRTYRGRVEYRIRWKGCSEDDDTWEQSANLCDSASEF